MTDLTHNPQSPDREPEFVTFRHSDLAKVVFLNRRGYLAALLAGCVSAGLIISGLLVVNHDGCTLATGAGAAQGTSGQGLTGYVLAWTGVGGNIATMAAFFLSWVNNPMRKRLVAKPPRAQPRGHVPPWSSLIVERPSISSDEFGELCRDIFSDAPRGLRLRRLSGLDFSWLVMRVLGSLGVGVWVTDAADLVTVRDPLEE